MGDLFEILINSVKYPLENSPRSVNIGGKKESRSESGRLKRGRKGREEDKGGREEDEGGREGDKGEEGGRRFKEKVGRGEQKWDLLCKFNAIFSSYFIS